MKSLVFTPRIVNWETFFNGSHLLEDLPQIRYMSMVLESRGDGEEEYLICGDWDEPFPDLYQLLGV
jgi:hypothetical protein